MPHSAALALLPRIPHGWLDEAKQYLKAGSGHVVTRDASPPRSAIEKSTAEERNRLHRVWGLGFRVWGLGFRV